jgi:peptide-methionine (R)-S-oxide reductase
MMHRFFIILVLVALTNLTACAQKRIKHVVVNGNPTQTSLAKYPAVTDKVVKSDEEWKRQLPPLAYDVLRHEGTERSFTGSLLNEHRKGIFTCAGCGNPLFSSETKFESGTGWPSFYAPIEPARVTEKVDNTYGTRVEIECARCSGHLGHVFEDGPKPTGLRYCMNSAALGFQVIKN